MSVKIIPGDVTNVVPESHTSIYIPHIVNNDNVMGSGVAYALSKKWYRVKRKYHADRQLLGDSHMVHVDHGITVINMVAQTKPGGEYINGEYVPPIRLGALEQCMMDAKYQIYQHVHELVTLYDHRISTKIIAPKFGSLRAGGDFDKDILPLIEKYWGNFDVTIYEFEER